MMNEENQVNPSLFGLSNSNRDFLQKDSWGKNQFNSSFPASLACYMHSIQVQPVYIKLNSFGTTHEKISVTELFGEPPLSDQLFFAFESDFVTYRKIVIGRLPRVDLVTQHIGTNQDSCLKSLEIKLTALPDNSTYRLSDDKYGCEIVVRPDTIVYLALSIADKLQNSKETILQYLDPVFQTIENLTSIRSVLPKIPEIVIGMDNLLLNYIDIQSQLVMQPVWKTVGKTSKLFSNCLDIRYVRVE